MINYKASILVFISDSDIPFTNNQAERDIRCVKIKMKVLGSFRAAQGANAYARIQSVISTLRKQDMDVLVLSVRYSLKTLQTYLAYILPISCLIAK